MQPPFTHPITNQILTVKILSNTSLLSVLFQRMRSPKYSSTHPTAFAHSYQPKNFSNGQQGCLHSQCPLLNPDWFFSSRLFRDRKAES